jgi:hypothetical protein
VSYPYQYVQFDGAPAKINVTDIDVSIPYKIGIRQAYPVLYGLMIEYGTYVRPLLLPTHAVKVFAYVETIHTLLKFGPPLVGVSGMENVTVLAPVTVPFAPKTLSAAAFKCDPLAEGFVTYVVDPATDSTHNGVELVFEGVTTDPATDSTHNGVELVFEGVTLNVPSG